MSISKFLTAIVAVSLSTAALATTTVIDKLPANMAKMQFDLRLADTPAIFNKNCNGGKNLKDNLLCEPGVYAVDFEQVINLAGPYIRICDPKGDSTDNYCQHTQQLTHCALDSESLDGKTVTLSIDPSIKEPTVTDVACTIS